MAMKIVQQGHHDNPHEQSYKLVPGLLEGIGPQVLSTHSPPNTIFTDI